jgi:hypothetical protein
MAENHQFHMTFVMIVWPILMAAYAAAPEEVLLSRRDKNILL